MPPDIPILRDLIVLLAVVLPIVFVCQKLRFPPVVGFLVAGVVIGPSGLQLIKTTHTVETFAEVGVVLLMFTIGLEVSLSSLLDARRYLIWGGGLYVLLIVGATLIVARLIGFPYNRGLFLGFLVALSSTAIVLKSYTDRREVDSPHGRLATVILIFQDLCIVPMMLIIPLMGGVTTVSVGSIGLAIGKALAIIVVIIVTARRLVPGLLHQVVRLRNREVFALFIIFLCFGTAWLTSSFGLSLALGAFIAGVILSESEYSHQAVAVILPLRDTFSGIFFLSIGMLLDVGFVLPVLPSLSTAVVGLIGLKVVVAIAVLWPLTRSVRVTTMVAMSLAQVGEFSFILVEVGRDVGLMTGDLYQTFLMVSIVTILLTPLLISLAPRVGFQIALWIGGKGERPMVEKDGDIGWLKGHVVIVGYGLNGQNVARVLDETGIPYIVLELNTDMVRKARVEGRPVCFGDATSRDILEKAGLSEARVMVVAISDPAATRRVVWQARQVNPEVYIIARTRYVSEIDDLYTLGANQVIPEEFETSLEIVSRVLREYHIPRNIIVLQIDLIRRERYGMMRGLHLPARTLDQLHSILAQTTTDTVLIPDGAPVVGKTLGEMEIRMKTGVTVLAIVRGGAAVTNPGPDTRVEAGDVLVLVGDHAALDQAIQFLTVED